MSIGQVDPKIQALFDENIARTRSANTEVSAKLKADQDRLAAEAKAREDKHQKDLATSRASAQNVAQHGDRQQHRKPQWEQRDRSASELAFGPEDDDGGYSPAPASAPQPPPVAPPPLVAPPPPPPMRSRRPARADDDEDDLSGQTWLS